MIVAQTPPASVAKGNPARTLPGHALLATSGAPSALRGTHRAPARPSASRIFINSGFGLTSPTSGHPCIASARRHPLFEVRDRLQRTFPRTSKSQGSRPTYPFRCRFRSEVRLRTCRARFRDLQISATGRRNIVAIPVPVLQRNLRQYSCPKANHAKLFCITQACESRLSAAVLCCLLRSCRAPLRLRGTAGTH